MTKRLNQLFVSGLLTTGLLISSTSNSETLLEVYQQALQNDHQFRAAQAQYEAGKELKNLGRAGLLPKINAQGNWSESETDSSGFQQNPIDGATDLSNPDQYERKYSETTIDSSSSGYSASLVQPIFDLAAWHGFKAGSKQAQIAEATFKADQQDLIIRTATAYFDVLKAIDSYNTAVAEETAFEHQLKQTKQRFEVGLTAITEVHEVKAAYDSAMAARLLAEGQAGIAFEALEVITGHPYNQLNPLRTEFPVSHPIPTERQAWVEQALQNNFSLERARLNAGAAKHQAKEAKAGHYPKLTGSVIYNKNDEQTANNILDPYSDNEIDTQVFKLELSVPIYNGGATSASRRRANKLYIAADEEYKKAQRDTIQAARSTHLSATTAVATVTARKQAITSSRSALEATQAGYDVGTRDLVDVLQAQRNMYLAERNYYEALYAYVLFKLQLKQVAGTLTEEDIVELDQWLDKSKPVSRI
ncbi:TolC family outer membrane protein [Teredinibacter sp. KSP-S5-2]|uniref:TolC family outer membrane protein n=1 Tax=Teredinibacter sp. KSP-S5-2 TaxID=3034506 RepID=UPI002934A0E8|nr:TolC family outer membrane protein [Teredinibacter sp. KSP-S5-2]WNO09395.1 TolC family outer membrane protein [Teredinibacter sp. KSP-S5-2]